MKVLYVVSGASFLSSHPWRKREAIVRCWCGLGHEVELICGGDILSPQRRKRMEDGYADRSRRPWYREIALLAPFVNSVSEIMNLQNDRRLAAVVTRKIAEFRPDLYWQRSSRLDGLTLAAGRRAGIPTVLEWKDHILSLYGASLLKPYAAWVERQKELKSDFVVVESGVLKEQLAAVRRDGSDSILVAHNAIDPAEFAATRGEDHSDLRSRAGVSSEDFCAIFVGSFAYYHRVELLVEAVAKARTRSATPIHAVLVGDGPGKPAAETRARELGVSDLVHFVGRVPIGDVSDWLATADAAVLPDGTDIITPIKVQEYMASGLPTLAPDYPVNREVLEDGRTGLLFTPRSADAISDALLRLASAPELRREIGEAAGKLARERFTWESTWGKVLNDIGLRIGAVASTAGARSGPAP
jgi:glycosyltransferase involved in cell wall biosynthesis